MYPANRKWKISFCSIEQFVVFLIQKSYKSEFHDKRKKKNCKLNAMAQSGDGGIFCLYYLVLVLWRRGTKL
jgi:hypothetical protein